MRPDWTPRPPDAPPMLAGPTRKSAYPLLEGGDPVAIEALLRSERKAWADERHADKVAAGLVITTETIGDRRVACRKCGSRDGAFVLVPYDGKLVCPSCLPAGTELLVELAPEDA